MTFTSTDSPSCTVSKRRRPTSTPTTTPASFASGSGTSHTTAAYQRTPPCFTVHSRTGPANRHASRIRTLPVRGSRTVLPEHLTVPGPLSARKARAERLRDLNRGRPNLHFLPAFFAYSSSDQKRPQASSSAASAYFAAFWLSRPCQGASSAFNALKNGRRRWCRVAPASTPPPSSTRTGRSRLAGAATSSACSSDRVQCGE